MISAFTSVYSGLEQGEATREAIREAGVAEGLAKLDALKAELSAEQLEDEMRKLGITKAQFDAHEAEKKRITTYTLIAIGGVAVLGLFAFARRG